MLPIFKSEFPFSRNFTQLQGFFSGNLLNAHAISWRKVKYSLCTKKLLTITATGWWLLISNDPTSFCDFVCFGGRTICTVDHGKEKLENGRGKESRRWSLSHFHCISAPSKKKKRFTILMQIFIELRNDKIQCQKHGIPHFHGKVACLLHT